MQQQPQRKNQIQQQLTARSVRQSKDQLLVYMQMKNL